MPYRALKGSYPAGPSIVVIRVLNFIKAYFPWMILVLVAYWLWWDNAPVSTVVYQHPKFVSAPVESRDDANALSITEARQGTQVYRYVEWCVNRKRPGEVRKTWVDGIVFQVPPVPTTSVIGCFKRSIAEQVPPIPGHMVDFQAMSVWPVNPLYVQELWLEKIPLKVLP